MAWYIKKIPTRNFGTPTSNKMISSKIQNINSKINKIKSGSGTCPLDPHLTRRLPPLVPSINMEDIIISVPRMDISLLEQLIARFGWKIYRPTAADYQEAQNVFTAMRQQAAQDHEWTLDEINAEIAQARQSRINR